MQSRYNMPQRATQFSPDRPDGKETPKELLQETHMSRSPITLLALGACAASAMIGLRIAMAGPATDAATAPQAAPAMIGNLRNTRYCELLTVVRQGLNFVVNVYNTTGLNLCPAEKWAALDAKVLAKQLKVGFVKLNGPRYWTLDAIEAGGPSASGPTVEFGGIAMKLRATLKTKLWQGTVGDKFYRPNRVRRTTVFHYQAGAPVYDLVSPAGNVYMMQSYSQIIDPKLSVDDLPQLGKRLKLPAGWTYQTRTLTGDYALKADGIAYVINDDLYNSYQRRPK